MRKTYMEYLEERATVLSENVAGWEDGVLRRIGKRIGQIGKMSREQAQALNNIAVVKQDMTAVTKELASMTAKNVNAVKTIYADACASAHLENKLLYDHRGYKFTPFAENRHLQAITSAFARETADAMLNLSSTSVLCTIDETGRVVSLSKAYQNAIDKAVMQVASGAGNFHGAMRDTIKALGGNGVRVGYGSGITRRLDTAVRQSVMYGGKRAGQEYANIIGQELGCDGIEIDYHDSPRPSHEFMQGRQFSLHGRVVIDGVEYDDATEALERLEDYNCYHYATPIILGVSVPRYDSDELARLKERDAEKLEVDGAEGTRYEWTQNLRKLETATRQEKTIRDLAHASGDTALAKKCTDRIKAMRGAYDNICDKTGIAPDYSRMAIIKMQNAS